MIVDKKDWDDLANYRESLEHHGVKGMKWYQHIFGREQGHAKYSKSSGGSSDKKTFRDRLNDAAKKRASEKAAKEKAKADKKAAEEKVKAEKEAAAKEKKRQDILKNPTKLYKHRDEFTYDEIKAAMERFKWEKQLNEYSEAQLKRGATFIQTINTYTNNAINLYNAAARIVNSVTGDGNTNTLPFVGNIDASKNKNKASKDNKGKDNNDGTKKVNEIIDKLSSVTKSIDSLKKEFSDTIDKLNKADLGGSSEEDDDDKKKK